MKSVEKNIINGKSANEKVQKIFKVLVGVLHYDLRDREKITGIRVVDMRTYVADDISIEQAKLILKSPGINIKILNVGLSEDGIYGTNGSLNRYAQLYGDNTVSNANAFVIMYKKIDGVTNKCIGYITCDAFNNQHDISSMDKMLYTKTIANGKVVSGSISAINGHFPIRRYGSKINHVVKKKDSAFSDEMLMNAYKGVVNSLRSEGKKIDRIKIWKMVYERGGRKNELSKFEFCSINRSNRTMIYAKINGCGEHSEVVLPMFVNGISDISESVKGKVRKITLGMSFNDMSSLTRFAGEFEKLERVNVDYENSLYIERNGAVYSSDMTTLLYCPTMCKLSSERGIIYLGGSVQRIAVRAFSGNKAIVSMIISDEVAVIGDEAFLGSNFTYLEIKCNNTEIGDYAFSMCNRLERVEMRGSLSKIGKGVFAMCKELKHVGLPDVMNEIPERTFFECRKLVEVVMSSTVCYIGKNAFTGCRVLSSIELPMAIRDIDNTAFTGSVIRRLYVVYAKIGSMSSEVFRNDKFNKLIHVVGKDFAR